MEYRYGQLSKWPVILNVIILIVFTPFAIWTYFITEGTQIDKIMQAFPTYIMVLFIMMYSSFKLRLYAKKIKDDVIIVDDQGIVHNRQGTCTEIFWNDVISVKWGSHLPSWRAALSIEATGNTIEIGYFIQDLSRIIAAVKSKVGDRFDTTNIPWELKHGSKK